MSTVATKQPKKSKTVKVETPPVVEPVKVEQPPLKIEHTNGTSPRMVAIHHLWDIIQAGPLTLEQLGAQIAQRLVTENKMDTEAATKLAANALNHQLPYEMGEKGRKSIRIRKNKNKLEWIGGVVRRRHAVA